MPCCGWLTFRFFAASLDPPRFMLGPFPSPGRRLALPGLIYFLSSLTRSLVARRLALSSAGRVSLASMLFQRRMEAVSAWVVSRFSRSALGSVVAAAHCSMSICLFRSSFLLVIPHGVFRGSVAYNGMDSSRSSHHCALSPILWLILLPLWHLS